MIPLPPGCTVSYQIWIDVDRLTDDMSEWFEMIGGTVSCRRHEYHRSGGAIEHKSVQYGKAKPSYRRQDGTGYVKINFNGNDVATASMFLIKFSTHIVAHNMKQELELVK